MQEPPRTYFGSALRLSRKRPAVISEAPSAYFGSTSRLLKKRLAVISEAPSGYAEAPRAYSGSALRFRGANRRNISSPPQKSCKKRAEQMIVLQAGNGEGATDWNIVFGQKSGFDRLRIDYLKPRGQADEKKRFSEGNFEHKHLTCCRLSHKMK